MNINWQLIPVPNSRHDKDTMAPWGIAVSTESDAEPILSVATARNKRKIVAAALALLATSDAKVAAV